MEMKVGQGLSLAREDIANRLNRTAELTNKEDMGILLGALVSQVSHDEVWIADLSSEAPVFWLAR